MIRYECDRCGRQLGANDSERFIVKFEVYAAAGPVEFTAADLQRDHEAEMQEVLEQLAAADPDEIEDQTYRCLRFDLCRDCQRRLLQDPLGSSQ
ncbi:MAG: hypothetical protein ACYSUI_20620, partial [Planctomycetota bacterium]|jgi:hypothetical protein